MKEGFTPHEILGVTGEEIFEPVDLNPQTYEKSKVRLSYQAGQLDMKPNQERHNLNLHGGNGFDGLTGFYHGTYYKEGTPAKNLPKGGVLWEKK